MPPPLNSFAILDETLSLDEQNENESLKERLLELYLLYSISKTYNVSLQAAGLLESTSEFLKKILKINSFCLMLLDRDSNELKIWNADEKAMKKAAEVRFKLGEGISGLVAESGKAILVQDVKKDKRFLHYKGKITNIGAFLSVPLLTGDGETLGVLNIHKTKPQTFRDSDKEFFSAMAYNLAQALDRARRYECALKKSMYDDLTRLYNRRFLLDCAKRELSKAQRNNAPFSLLLLDLDYFKSINDRYGHALGDQVLAKMAVLLKTGVRQSDVVARYGGEEFVVLLPDTDQQGAWHAGEKIRTLIEQRLALEMKLKGKDRITVTIGTASFPEVGATVAEMLNIADQRLYLGKEQGRNRVIGSDQDPAPLKKKSRRDNRRHIRYQTALRIVRGSNHIHSIDISSNNQWSLCSLMDASLDGFHSMVAFEPEIGARYPCRAMDGTGQPLDNLFTVQVRHVEPLTGTRFLMGVQVVKGHVQTWEKLYQSLIH